MHGFELEARSGDIPVDYNELHGYRHLLRIFMFSGRTIYQLKHGLLDDYLIQQLVNPSLNRVLA
jgi:hypothetical protein